MYDAFGFHAATFQGCDRLAASTNALIFVPDFLGKNAMPPDFFPPDTEEKMKFLERAKETMAPPKHIPNVWKVVDELTEKKGITTWGGLGFCWGGMMTSLTSAEGTKFKASGTGHPG